VPSAVPPSFGVCRTRCDRRADRCPPRCSTEADRRCPISLALCAGAYWRPRLSPPRVRSGGSRVHSLSSSSRLAPTAGSLGRRATGTRPVHSPFFVMWPGVCRRPGERVKRPARDGPSGARNPGNGGREGPDTAGTGGRSRTADTAERPIRCASRRPGSGDSCRRGRAMVLREPASVRGRQTSCQGGGEGGIRTHEVSRLSAFQERRHQPLGHLSRRRGYQRRARPPIAAVRRNIRNVRTRRRSCRQGDPAILAAANR
jgi:hypothetical protein